MNRTTNLNYLIENEFFIICPFLSTDRFISYCKERGIETSREQLEQFEKLGIFYPVARVHYRKIKIKVEFVFVDDSHGYRDLGILSPGEKWNGDIREEYSHFWFEKEYARNWLENGFLWEPSTRPFEAWETFIDENGDTQIESFYSIFQCYTLCTLIQSTKIELGVEDVISCNKEDLNKLLVGFREPAEKRISAFQKKGIRGDAVAVCQIIANRYFPATQSDRRSIQLSIPSYYHNWDWYEYCRNWDAKAVLADLGMSIDELKRLHEVVTLDAKFADPLERWYELITFVSLEQKKKLKGKALLAQTLYSMEQMLRLFYEELTGNRLPPPHELPGWKKDKFYGEGVTQNELQYLEFLTNRFHINPRPKLILFVEGPGEEEQFPRLAKHLGYPFPRIGIEVRNLEGVSGFEGKKHQDRHGALVRLIDDYHYRQTICFVVLDNEGRVSKVKNNLLQATSRYYPKRKVTKKELIHDWKKNIEFDNFSPDEIARAMTELCKGRYVFIAEEIEEIADCENPHSAKEGNPLGRLFKKRLNDDMSKLELLNILFGFIISHPENEFDADGKPKRPVVQIIHKLIELAARNYQPVTSDIWRRNQESGYFGNSTA